MRMKTHPQYFISKPRRSSKVGITIGIDLGDIWSHYCTLNEEGEVVDRGRFRTNPSGVDKRFWDIERARVAMETGTHSIWVSEQIEQLGHEVIVANVRELRALSHSDRKSDKVDAEKIARYARLDPEILRPITHRTVGQQETLTLIRARDVLVRLRTGAVNSVRGLAKPCGYRLPASSTLTFAKRCLTMLPPGLAQALGPLLQQIADMTVKIKQYDREIQKLTETAYPETQALIKVYGVGHLTALTFVLTLGNKQRFQRSRDVGCLPRPAAATQPVRRQRPATWNHQSRQWVFTTVAGRVRQPRHRATRQRLNPAKMGSKLGCPWRKPCATTSRGSRRPEAC